MSKNTTDDGGKIQHQEAEISWLTNPFPLDASRGTIGEWIRKTLMKLYAQHVAKDTRKIYSSKLHGHYKAENKDKIIGVVKKYFPIEWAEHSCQLYDENITFYLSDTNGVVVLDIDPDENVVLVDYITNVKDAHQFLKGEFEKFVFKRPKENEGKAYVLISDADGLSTTELGVVGVELEMDNYSEDIHKEIDSVIQDLKSSIPQGRLVILEGEPGTGKCLGKGTKVLMADGSVKLVEQIQKNEYLMGPDSSPRKVLSITKGKEQLVKIKPVKGDEWICNRSHILSLVHSVTNEIKNISIDDLLKMTERQRHHLKLYRTSIEFEERSTELDPYFIGLWLGDGTRGVPCVTTADFEIKDYLQEFAKSLKMRVTITEQENNKSDLIFIRKKLYNRTIKNVITEEIKKCETNNHEKKIPSDYLHNSREKRLLLFAGILDSDGYFQNNGFEIVTKYNTLKEDILFLARSLGFAAYASIKHNKEYNGNYWRISISGDCSIIPNRVKRKKASIRRQKKNVLRTGFQLELLEEDEYYGFEIGDDHLFVLGDFTVTHNTFFVRSLVSQVPEAFFVVIPPAMVKNLGDPSIVPTLLDLKSDYSRSDEIEERTHGPVVLIVEDADECLVHREADNMSSISSILNFTSGILGDLLDIRIIATTNAKKTEFDEALVRSGRISSFVHIDKLSRQEAIRVYRRIMGDDTLDYDGGTLLADIYSLAKETKKELGVGEEKSQRKTKQKTALTVNKFGKLRKIGF